MDTETQDKLTSTPEQVSPHVSLEWQHDRKIVVYNFEIISATEEAAIVRNKINEVFANWPADQPYAVMYHFKKITWSPMLRKQAEDDYQMLPSDKETYMAVVLPNTPLAHMIRLFMRAQERKYRNTKIESRSFMSYDEAMSWLKESLS